MSLVTFVNKAAFMARMANRIDSLEDHGDDIAEEVANEIAELAAEFAPVKTGATRDNIRAERRGTGWAVVADRGGDQPEVPMYLEYGTRNMPAQPFLGPAADIVQSSGGVERAARKTGGLLGN